MAPTTILPFPRPAERPRADASQGAAEACEDARRFEAEAVRAPWRDGAPGARRDEAREDKALARDEPREDGAWGRAGPREPDGIFSREEPREDAGAFPQEARAAPRFWLPVLFAEERRADGALPRRATGRVDSAADRDRGARGAETEEAALPEDCAAWVRGEGRRSAEALRSVGRCPLRGRSGAVMGRLLPLAQRLGQGLGGSDGIVHRHAEGQDQPGVDEPYAPGNLRSVETGQPGDVAPP